MIRIFLTIQSPLIHLLAGLLVPAWYYSQTAVDPSYGALLFCLFFALLPDIDSRASIVGRAFPFISEPLERRFGHRQVTHSLLAVSLISIVNGLIFRADWWLLSVAYCSHLFIDMLTGYVGIPLLWPHQMRFYLMSIRPGSYGELLLGLIIAALLLIPLFRTSRQFATALVPQEDIVIPTQTPTPSPTPRTVAIRIDNIHDLESEIMIRVGDTISEGQVIADLHTYRQVVATATATSTPTVTPTPTATSTPTATPVPTWRAPTAYEMTRAVQELNEAHGRYMAAAYIPTPNTNNFLHAEAELSEAQICYDLAVAELAAWSASDSPPPDWTIAGKEKERDDCHGRIQQWQAHLHTLTNPGPRLGAEAAYWQYQQAIQRYEATAAAWTPIANNSQGHGRHTTTLAITATPTPTPTTGLVIVDSTSTPPSEFATPQSAFRTPHSLLPDETQVTAIVSGTVLSVQVVNVQGNAATVEITVAVPFNPALDPAPTSPPLPPLLPNPSNPPNPLSRPVIPLRITDGDTLTVRFQDGTEETIRLLGVDTPETVHPEKEVECYGPEASTYAKTMLCGHESGRNCPNTLWVETDTLADERDRYGRTLAHIRLSDGTLFNEQLLSNGYARYNNYGNPSQYQATYLAAERAARTIGRGLWSACPLEKQQ